MNTEAEPTSPGALAGKPDEKPNRVRVALLTAVLVAMSAHMLTQSSVSSGAGALSAVGAAKTSPEERYQTANSLIAEVHGELRKTPCHFADKGTALVRLKELPAVIPSWQQTARVEPSELLRSLQRIAETTNCYRGAGAARDAQGAPPDAPRAAPDAPRAPEVERLRSQLEKLRSDLEKQLEQDVRSLFARLRRAEREGDRESALRNVSELQELLRYHRGPLVQHLERLARVYSDP